jgi:hypothetical protein
MREAAPRLESPRSSADSTPRRGGAARYWHEIVLPTGYGPLSVYDWLMFLHVTAAFCLVMTVVMFSAVALGAPADSRVLAVSNVLWTVGGLGTLVFGVWLAIYVKGYEIWDGWIIAALVLWAGATELGRRAELGIKAGADGAASADRSRAVLMHWLRSLAVLALLVVMIYKPGA